MGVFVRTLRLQWVALAAVAMLQVAALSGPNVCMLKQKYNITKRVKYRAPMSVRTYVWCFAMPPRCSRWSTEMRDLTRLETEERTAEMAACCPGHKMKGLSCVPECPPGKTGHGCADDCPPGKWGVGCARACPPCGRGVCAPATGECLCHEGWQGESCETSMTTTPSVMMEQLLTTARNVLATKTTLPVTATTQSTINATATVTYPATTLSTAKSTKATTQSTLATTVEPTVATTTSTTYRPEVTSKSTFNSTTMTAITTNEPIVEVARVNKDETSLHVPRVLYTNTSSSPGTEIVPTDMGTVTTEHSRSVPTTLILHTKATSVMTKVNTNAVTTTEHTTTSIRTATSTKTEITRKTDVTLKPTTAKFKPKEIWIRPAQKGESPLVDIKLNSNQELPHSRHKPAIKKATVPENTTPKTIIVSIIPTSVTYTTFKKLALTASFITQKGNVTLKSSTRPTNNGFTKPMTVHATSTSTHYPHTVKIPNASQRKENSTTITVNPILQRVLKTNAFTPPTKETQTTASSTRITNSMTITYNAHQSSDKRLNSSNLLTTPTSTNAPKTTQRHIELITPVHATTSKRTEKVTERPSLSKSVTVERGNVTMKVTNPPKVTKIPTGVDTNTRANLTNSKAKTNAVTDAPADEEPFHILTEPEHITAVMSDKGSGSSSMDLVSVISIAGGVMMAVITVAVVIVMLERCKRPRYEDVGKYNDVGMQVMVDRSDVPPPYVRSIFHTPLPDPPKSEKCHYQPISTLDRNLKQFMRPVVVQTISPLMLENFRGILECHYDHLPRRSCDMEHCPAAPSMEERRELLQPRTHSMMDSTIEALKCEAKLDVIDHTTSEPLYAEIPCWRPPSEHAVEVVNLNGEAVTEL